MNETPHETESAQKVTSLDRRRERAALPAEDPPAIEMFMDDERVVFRDEAALNEYVRGATAQAWGEGWQAARQVVELDGVKVWAHTVLPEGYEGNPYLSSPSGVSAP